MGRKIDESSHKQQHLAVYVAVRQSITRKERKILFLSDFFVDK